MKPTFNEKLIAYLTLLSGLSISAVAVYYSVVGLTAIFAAAVVPIVIMGITLEISKLIATIWLKQNWAIAPKTIKFYLIIAVIILMFITSLGIFGFLSKAHSDQSLVSGDALSKIAVYDERIKTAKENIEADRRQLKQMDEAVDQVMARSTTEQGADKSVAIRKAQARDRNILAKNIEANQKIIAALNDEAAPIRAEIRKIEAEVGPLKYIAAFVYDDTDKTVLEKSVTWVIIIIVLVFDPLAVVLLLASQYSFQNFREREAQIKEIIELPKETMEGNSPEKESDVVSTATVTEPFPVVDIDSMQTTINEDHDNLDMGETEDWKKRIREIENSTPWPFDSPKEFDINDHPYLFNVPKNYHPPGIEPVGPRVHKEKVEIDIQEESAQLIESKPLNDIELKAKELQENVKKFGYSSENNIVKVAGKDYSKDEFDKLMSVSYTQNDDLKSITQEEYIQAIKEKQNKE